MNFIVNEIFQNKIKEIESRLPISFANSSDYFKTCLKTELNNNPKRLNTNNLANNSQNNLLSNFNSKNLTSINSTINNAVKLASQKYNVSENLIHAVIKNESSYNPNAISSCGAQGLMQLMPQTAKYLGVTNSFDIYQNIDGGTKYLSEQLKTFDNNLSLALAAYNAGPSTVKKYGGIPPYSETKNYVKNILKSLN